MPFIAFPFIVHDIRSVMMPPVNNNPQLSKGEDNVIDMTADGGLLFFA
jgi:hypothetical protein